VSRDDVRIGFLTSAEYINQTPDVLGNMFMDCLGRAPAANDRAWYATMIAAQQWGTIARFVITSQEGRGAPQ